MSDFIEREAALSAQNKSMNLSECRKRLERIPAADVRPVVHGKWVQDCDYHFRCSVCGDRYVVSNGNPLDAANGWNFCPNCGADMREVLGDDNS
jgi:hypothetical protein